MLERTDTIHEESGITHVEADTIQEELVTIHLEPDTIQEELDTIQVQPIKNGLPIRQSIGFLLFN